MKGDSELLSEQIAYYDAAASEYDTWRWRPAGRDEGADARRRAEAERERIQEALAEVAPLGRVLEIACGTGQWTPILATLGEGVTALDSSPRAIELNRGRTRDAPVQHQVADVFTWDSTERFDTVFFAFWLSHVPPGLFGGFWERVASWLRPGGQVVFVDTLWHERYRSVGGGAREDAPDDYVATRTIADGREFDIVKVFYRPDTLEARLRTLGWTGGVRATGEFFLFGRVQHAGQ